MGHKKNKLTNRLYPILSTTVLPRQRKNPHPRLAVTKAESRNIGSYQGSGNHNLLRSNPHIYVYMQDRTKFRSSSFVANQHIRGHAILQPRHQSITRSASSSNAYLSLHPLSLHHDSRDHVRFSPPNNGREVHGQDRKEFFRFFHRPCQPGRYLG